MMYNTKRIIKDIAVDSLHILLNISGIVLEFMMLFALCRILKPIL